LDGLTAEALGHLEKALTHEPNHVPALIALSNAYLDHGSFPEVEKLLKKALSFRQDQSEVFFLKARLLALQNDLESAAETIEEAITLEANQPKYFRLASDIAKDRQNLFERQHFLERLIDLEPLDGKAHYELGKLMHHPDDFDRVKLLFEISIDLLPNDTHPMFSLAQHLHAGEKSLPDGTICVQRELENAKQLLRKILSVDPRESKAKILLAEIELKSDEEIVAIRLLEEALEDQRTKGAASYELGLIWEKKGNTTKATRYYESAMEHEEWEALGEFRLALVMLGKGQTKDAGKHFGKCISSFKKKEEYLVKSKDHNLEKLDFHASRKELESLQLIRKCLGEANLGIYKCNYESRKDASFSRYLDEALIHYPHYPEANYEKGLRHIESGEEENAKERFEKSVEGNWNHWPSHMELAKIAKIGNELQKVEMHLKIVLDLDPENKTASTFLKKIQKASKK
jgi:tetratricopeptide (TPR) repeat protein